MTLMYHYSDVSGLGGISGISLAYLKMIKFPIK